MQAENCLSEIAALGEEAKHNARQNLGMGNAAVMDVQQDIYDRTAGRAALPGAFGYGSGLKAEPTFSAKNGPSEFLTWVRNAKQGRYYVSQYGGPNSRPIIDTSDNVVFSGVVEIIFPAHKNEVKETAPYSPYKLVLFYGVNGDVYFNRYWDGGLSGRYGFNGWEKWKFKVDDFTRVLRSGIGGVNWRNPDIGGLILAVYVGKSDGDQAITLNRLEGVQGSRLRLIDIKR
ncbi:phage tail protein, partial [Plesiomonas shigelloides]|uniref:phage tail protein n=1 Tax=Plesiomonas shigelloides TaxID=703 RepID=UPI0013CC427A